MHAHIDVKSMYIFVSLITFVLVKKMETWYIINILIDIHNLINQYLFTDIVLSRGVSNKVLFLHLAFKNLFFYISDLTNHSKQTKNFSWNCRVLILCSFIIHEELALQHVSMVFRSEKKWDVLEPLPDIG